MEAGEYEALGYSVFPCAGKRPARCSTWPNSEGFIDGDNVGLVVGPGCIVIDLDLKPGISGVDLLVGLMPLGWQHVGPRARTGGGGLHLWFRVPELLGLGNGRGDLPPGIDVRGGGRGYVVGPPSYHPDTGAQYEWLTPLVPPGELPPLPDWLLEHLLAKPALSENAAWAERGVGGSLSPYLQAVVDAEAEVVRNAAVGTGNDAINLAAYKMGGYAHIGLTRADAEAAIGGALAEWTWAKPADERAAWRTFESGWRSGERLPRAAPEMRSAAPGSAPRAGPSPEQPAAPAGEPPHSADVGPDDTGSAPVIRIGTDEQRVNDDAVAALAAAKYPDLYQRGGSLCRIVRITSRPGDELRLPNDTPAIRPMSGATLRERLTDCATWVRMGKEGWIPAHPPQWSYMAVGDRGEYPGIHPLRGIASYPMIRPDGSISCTAGYDVGTGYYLGALPEGLELRETATRDDAQEAMGALLELVEDFPFRDNVDRAAWLAYLLTPLARAVINGPTPLFLIEANVRGSGKTLLADVASLALTGRPLPAQTYPFADEELEKILVGVARLGLPLMCFDNVKGNIGGAVLDKWITSTSPTGRILGSNDLPQFDWTTVLVATANNASVSGDTDRRSIYVTLETEHERPEMRTGFKIPDLPAYLLEHRGKILRDALTILQAHYQAGLPSPCGRPKGTFEDWARRVRDPLLWAGLPDCERAPDDLARPVDSETSELAMLLAGIDEIFAGAWFTVTELFDHAFPPGREVYKNALLLREALTMMAVKSDRPTRQRVGKRLQAYRNRWLDDKALNNVMDKRRGSNNWRVVSREKGDR